MVLVPARAGIPAALAQARTTAQRVVLPAGWISPVEGAYDGVVVVALVGFPTGRHHSLIKATEARFAVQCGASEVLLTVDATVADPNELLADIMTVREAVSEQVPVWVLPGTAGQVPDWVVQATGTTVVPVAMRAALGVE